MVSWELSEMLRVEIASTRRYGDALPVRTEARVLLVDPVGVREPLPAVGREVDEVELVRVCRGVLTRRVRAVMVAWANESDPFPVGGVGGSRPRWRA